MKKLLFIYKGFPYNYSGHSEIFSTTEAVQLRGANIFC